MKTYRATEAVYVDERYIAAGEVFSTAAPKGNTWEEIDPLDHDGDGVRGGSRKGADSTASKGSAARSAAGGS